MKLLFDENLSFRLVRQPRLDCRPRNWRCDPISKEPGMGAWIGNGPMGAARRGSAGRRPAVDLAGEAGGAPLDAVSAA
jgi:hypothetical protein